MIGRNEQLAPFDLMKWAREMSAPQASREPFKLRDGRTYDPRLDDRAADGLRSLDAHVLLLLAQYADSEGKCWPGVKVLGERSGLRVHHKVDKRTGGSGGYTCSALSDSLGRLFAAGLVWWDRQGRRSVVRELLFDPSAHAEGEPRRRGTSSDANPSATTEGNRPDPSVTTEGGTPDPSVTTEGDPSVSTEGKGLPGRGQTDEGPQRKGQNGPPLIAAGPIPVPLPSATTWRATAAA